ncbi:TlpA family protein disulfide reductase [Pontibacter sp. FD36]|uniref:TlpA family protein disulfide reductase n=1 Tax=Pontibacter sp. FD36 TaxID=2789860 RepID=UPI0018AA5911|nr:TlpA disulfide reductase family protein [Pontibacter sp. FD36]MBF8963175.1 TlpA family protein disulfide reductase [Pontibacter sp. FD36]
MTRRKIFWTAYAVGFAVAGVIAVFAFYMLNQTVPQRVNWQALQLTSLQGEPISIDKYKGRVVVLNVWATWCKPCIEEMPAMDRLQQLHPDKIAVVTISDEELEKILKFRSRQPYSFTYLKANTPLANQQLTVYPTTYVLNPSGDVKEIYLGAQSWDSDRMQKRLLKYF